MANRFENYHDLTFFAVFNQPHRAAHVLIRHGPPELEPLLRWEGLKAKLGAHQTPAGRWRRPDLLFEAPMLPARSCVPVNLEHASGTDGTLMARQLLYSGLGLVLTQHRYRLQLR
jgi:hypothetical protein